MGRVEQIVVKADSPEPPPSKWRAMLALVSAQDLFVAGGLSLWAIAFWPDLRVALSVPAAVIVWYGLPSRPPFIERRKDGTNG